MSIYDRIEVVIQELNGQQDVVSALIAKLLASAIMEHGKDITKGDVLFALESMKLALYATIHILESDL